MKHAHLLETEHSFDSNRGDNPLEAPVAHVVRALGLLWRPDCGEVARLSCRLSYYSTLLVESRIPPVGTCTVIEI